MRRLPLTVFWALIAATVGAFFITQHLKVTTPLLTGGRVNPEVFNPIRGRFCNGYDHRETKLSFYLLYRPDDVSVQVLDAAGDPIRTLAYGRHMRTGVRVYFPWDGYEDNGTLAPDGDYHFRVELIHQNREFDLKSESGVPVTAILTTVPPRPVVESVSPQLVPAHGVKGVTIRYSGNENRGGTILLYRTDLPGRPRLVKSFGTPWTGHTAIWDETIGGRPAPAGTYLTGMEVTDVTCNTGYFPITIPPAPGSTPHAGVTVRYLAAQPPLVPVPAGSTAAVLVDAREGPYQWALTRSSAAKPAGSGRSDLSSLRVPIPGAGAGLYVLSLRSGPYRSAVPLVVSSPRPEPLLVVLPALTWQGLNPVDDVGDGLPDTLAAGEEIRLQRPLADGLPGGFGDLEALLAYLDRSHRPYDLTTDLGLIEDVGPVLAGHAAVILAGDERWLPAATRAALRDYVLGGGHLLSLGLDSLRAGVIVTAGSALDPTAESATDAFGAVFGPSIPTSGLITVVDDTLGIFSGTAGALGISSSYEPIIRVDPPAQMASDTVTSSGAAPIAGFRLGAGQVVEISLEGFASSLAHNVDAQELMSRILTVLSG